MDRGAYFDEDQNNILLPIYSTCPLYTSSGNEKIVAGINRSMRLPEVEALGTQATSGTTGPVPADSQR